MLVCKVGLRAHVSRLLYEGRANRAELAEQIVLLLDSAATEAYLRGVADSVSSAKRAAMVLLASTR